jgi:hypothetical protein
VKLATLRQPYIGEEIKTNGYYYSIDTVQFFERLHEPGKQILARVYFFYRNGVLHTFNTKFSDLDSLEKIFSGATSEVIGGFHYKEVPYSWGIFLIEGRRIKIEAWGPGTGGKHPTFTYDLNILSDTSFHQSYGNNTFYFRSFSPKPDSVNRFTNGLND